MLATVIVVVATLLFLTGTDHTVKKPLTVSAIDRQGITVITINRDGRQDITFNKQGDSWQMVAPRHARANNTRINAVLSVLQARSYAQLDAGKLDLDRFDLLKPAVTLMLDDYVFSFGCDNPLEGRRYLLFQKTIYLVDDGLYQQLQQPADFFVQTPSD